MKPVRVILLGLVALQATFGWIIEAVDDSPVEKSVSSQSTPLPLASPGFSIGAKGPTPSRLELFLDPHCPFSKELLPKVQAALEREANGKKIREQIEVFIHYVNLPFHPFSHSSIVGLKYLEAKKPEAVLPFLDLMFANLNKFNQELYDEKQSAVRQLISGLVKQAIGGDAPVPTDVFTDTYLQAARLTFKYAMNREVFGSPIVHLNYVRLDDVPSTPERLAELLKQYLR